MIFTTMQVADISTGYLEPSDLPLILDTEAPMHCMNEDESHGSMFYVPLDASTFDGYIQEARDWGFSARFVEIFQELHRQRIPYVRFDADGGDIAKTTYEPLPMAEGH